MTRERVGRPRRAGKGVRGAGRRRAGRRRPGHRRGDRRAAAGGVEDDARLAVHGPARRGPQPGRAGLRRGPPVREPGPRPRRGPRLRLLRRLPHRPARHPRGRHHGRRGRRRDPGQGHAGHRPQVLHRPGERPLADHPGRGRRAAEREVGQRRPQGRRGARPPHGLAAVRPLRRGRPADHPLPLPPPEPAHPVRGRDRRHAGTP
ncbi:hypothetical protein SGPA1_60181 [Streptomyces misionensis JCM 4497]